MNPERLIGDAKALALSLVRTTRPAFRAPTSKSRGESGYALLKLGAWTARQGHYITDYDMSSPRSWRMS